MLFSHLLKPPLRMPRSRASFYLYKVDVVVGKHPPPSQFDYMCISKLGDPPWGASCPLNHAHMSKHIE